MILILSVIFLDILTFYTDNVFLTDTYLQVQLALIAYFAWLWLKNQDIAKRSIFALLTLHIIFVALVDWSITYMCPMAFWAYNIGLLLIGIYLSHKRILRGHSISKKNINLIFHIPVNLQQTTISLPSEPVASFGMIVGNKLFQARYDKSTIQELEYNVTDIERKYVVIDTGYPISIITQNDIDILLKQKARQLKTLGLRLNCLRSFRHILNKLEGFEYEGELLPTWYLKKIMKEKK